MLKKELLINSISLSILIIIIAFLFSFRVYPYADDWTYAASVDFEGLKFWQWVVAQHVDHYIPIQKIAHHYLAKWSGFDFRVLVLLNAILAYAGVVIVFRLARLYRGRIEWGDALIPLCILSPSAAYFLWAFQFQFLSSIIFFVSSIFFIAQFSKSKKTTDLSIGLIFSILTTSSGMNGFILSAISVGLLSTYLFFQKKQPFNINWVNSTLYITLCVLFITILWGWAPSDASLAGSSLAERLKIYFLLHAAPFSIIAFSHTELYAFLICAISIAAFWRLFKKHFQGKLEFTDVILLVALFSSEMLLLGVAFGRAGAQGGWNNTILMHYGSLSILVPIFSWIILSGLRSEILKTTLGVFLVGLLSMSFHESYIWRHNYAASSFDKQLEVEGALSSIYDVNKLVENYALDLTWKNSDDAKSHVVNGLNKILAQGYVRYKFMPTFNLKTASQIKTSLISVGVENVIQNLGWKGSDFERTSIEGIKVYGSYIESDADRGSISLRLKRGDRLYYRSGPTHGQQTLKIGENGGSIAVLPVSLEWKVLEFSNPNLPDIFTVTFADKGVGWGEWSAIAVLSSGGLR